MCIICAKPVGAPVNKETLQRMFQTNPHGAGYMFAFEDKLYIRKGFMKFNDLMEDLRGLRETLPVPLKYLPIIFHFRISTQGGISPEMCHPYVVSNDYDAMKLQSVCSTMGFCHNGILTQYSDHRVADHNDSMEFLKEFLYDRVIENPYFYADKDLTQEILDEIGPSRIALMDAKGRMALYGSWYRFGPYYISHMFYHGNHSGGLCSTTKLVV